MESVGDGWRSELKKYFRSVECLTENALLLIKRDRIRNDLPFDEAFMKYFLHKTDLRITNVYVDLMYEERFGEESNQQSYESSGTGFQHRSASTIIGPESIEQIPIVIIQSNNDSSAPNTSSSTSFVQNDTQMCDQIVISIPSNQPQPDLPGVGNTQSHHAEEGTRNKSETTDESNPNKINRKTIAVNSRRTMMSTSSGADRSNYEDPLKRMTNSNTHQEPDTIDLTSDQEDTADNLSSDKNIGGQTQQNDRQRKACEASAAGSSKQMGKFRISLQDGTHLQSNKSRIAKPSEPTISINQIGRNHEQQSIGTKDTSTQVSVNDKKVEDELASTSGASANSHVKGQIELVLSQEIGDGIASETVEGISKDRGGDDVSRDVGDFPGPSQPTILRRERGNDSAVVNGHLKKKPKLADAVETKKRHKCDDCDYSTEHRWILTRHIRMHTNERPYECKICQKRFTQKPHLKGHMKTHRDLFQFQCSFCRVGFSDGMKWKSHERRCKAKGFECHLCKKVLCHKQHLVDHMRAHTGEKFRCSICQKQFSSNRCLTYHMKLHGKLFRFQCSNCRKGFVAESKWETHECRCKLKQYECFLCGKKFYQIKNHLFDHMRHKHTGEMPFGCSDCSMRFCSKSHLTHHTKRYHLNGN